MTVYSFDVLLAIWNSLFLSLVLTVASVSQEAGKVSSVSTSLRIFHIIHFAKFMEGRARGIDRDLENTSNLFS